MNTLIYFGPDDNGAIATLTSRMCEESGWDLISTHTIASLMDVIARQSQHIESPCVHIVVDRRDLPAGEAENLRGLLATTGTLGSVPVSVFYDLLSDEDMYEIFTTVDLDQAVEVRRDENIADSLFRIREHIHSAVQPLPDNAFEIGSIFQIATDDYGSARKRSLVSQRLGGFVAELRHVMLLLNRSPLIRRVPWDPWDRQDAAVVRSGPGGHAKLDLQGRVPNLSDLFTARESSTAHHILQGDGPEISTDTEWASAWAGGRKPPLLLLTGETGTGKTLVARFIADMLLRRQRRDPQYPVHGRFIKVNSGGLVSATLEHRLFGAAAGQWTGIEVATPGELAQAAHGVVFFDEIGDLDPEVQRGLLTYFDDRFIRPRGVTPFRSFQHIIAATNRDVREGAYQQWFRNDLLERFTLQLEIPPLRSRGADEIRQLVDFVAQDPDENPVIDGSRLVTHIAAPALEDLVHRSYRNGNFRELTRTVRDGLRAAMARHSRVVELSDLAREEALHVRSDRDLARLDATDVHVPDAVALVTVAREGDLRLLANRERRAVIVDSDGTHWVFTSGCYYTFTP